MEIKRVDTYQDDRFSQKVLYQHGCFLVDEMPYEVEIISSYEAVIWGENPAVYPELVEAYRFYTPHITCFYDKEGNKIREYPRVRLITIPLDQIQPSQFYIDQDKIAAISSFIHKADDIIIQVMPWQGYYISLDGHTRLYYAFMKGWKNVRAVIEVSDSWVYDFVEEARKRDIRSPGDMALVAHDDYEEKWNKFCDRYFERVQE